MGKITQESIDREEIRKPRRKQRKKDLDRIHSKILQAKRKLDNVGKNDKVGQKKQSRARICNRLLPEPAAGIYRNGAQGKDIQRADTLENTFHKARLKADALKLFNGDTHGSKCIVKIPTRDQTVEQSPNKNYMKNNLVEWTPCILEKSPVLGKKPSQNQKSCLIKKKGENIFDDTNINKIKQNPNNELKHSQKENICKRRLFQNDREQLETITTTSNIQIFDETDLIKGNKTNKEETEQMCSRNKDSAYTPLNLYVEFCKIISAENFEVDILQNYHLDPVTATIKRLRHAYAESFRQQLLRKKNKQELDNNKQELEHVEPAYSVEHQACTSSDISQLSPVDFEVPKSSENHTIAVYLEEDSSSQKNDTFYLQNAGRKKSDDITRYSSTYCALQNTYNANTSIVENCENNNTQHSKQSKDICQLPKSSFYFINDKNSIQLDSQKNSSYINHLSRSKRHDKDNFSIDISGYENSRINTSKLLKASFLSDSILSQRHFSNDSEKLPAGCDNYALNNVSQKFNNITTNKCNEVKNIKRIPTILRRYNNVTNNKVTDTHKKCEANFFNRNSNNNIENELYETAFPNVKNLSTSSTMNSIFDRTKVLEPQIELMKIKDSQESQVEQFDINIHPKEHNERNGFYRYDDSLYPRTSETSYNTNAYSEKLPQQEQISPDVRKRFHSNRPINYLQGVNFSNSNVEATKEFPQQTKLHVCETNKQPLSRKNTRNQNENILFNNVNNKAIPTSIFPQNIQTEKRSTKSCREIFDKTDVECAKNQIDQNACHCNEQYIYFDSADCPRKYKEQVHYFKETSQPERYNSIDNCVNLSSTIRNVPLLSLKQKNNLYAYPKAIDEHHAVLLQNVTQPVKYLAVKNGSDIQRIPIYINDRSVRVAESVPLKVIAVMDPSTQTKVFPQEIATQVVPLQTDSLHLNDFATRKISDQSFIKHLDSASAILYNPDSQSNIWYASNL